MSKLAMRGGTPVHNTRARPWPRWPEVGASKWETQSKAFREVYLSATEGLPQPRGRRFAKAYCDYLGAKHGLLTQSGTNALKIALAARSSRDKGRPRPTRQATTKAS